MDSPETTKQSSPSDARKLEVQYVPIASLKPWKANPRRNDEAVDGIVRSIERFGYTNPVLVRRADNRIIAGHTRIKALQKIGETHAPVIFLDLGQTDADLYALFDNKSTENTPWDNDKLSRLFVNLTQLQADVSLTGFSPDEIQGFTGAAFAEPDPGDDEVPKPPKRPITKPGDLWILGEHRLLCGDSTKKEDVDRCLPAERPSLMVTDPPYGVSYEATWRHKAGVNNSARTGAVANDNRASWSEAFNLFGSDVAYVWHGAIHAAEVERSLSTCGFELRAQIIWVKPRFVLSRGHYHWRHEPCFYAVRKNKLGGGHWTGGRKQATVWADIVDHFAEKQNLLVCPIDADTLYAFDAGRTTVWQIAYDAGEETVHSTQKPVECMARPMRHNSSAGSAVSDPFLGSGSTIIAAEKLNRRCFGMEIDPVYCDVIVERWEKFTGGKAKREKA